MYYGITSTIFGTGPQNITLIFQVQYISAFLENNTNTFLYVNKVESLSFPMISISHLR